MELSRIQIQTHVGTYRLPLRYPLGGRCILEASEMIFLIKKQKSRGHGSHIFFSFFVVLLFKF